MPLSLEKSGRNDDWMATALKQAVVPAEAQKGLWIGGLALPFAEIYSPVKARWAEQFTSTAFDVSLAEAMLGRTSVSFCADHSCSITTGLIGRTANKGMISRYWVERNETAIGPAGLYVVGQAAEYDGSGSPGATIAAQIERGNVDGLSISGWIIKEEAQEAEDKDDYKYLFEISQFKLMETSVVAKPAFKDTFAIVGRLEEMKDDDKEFAAWGNMLPRLPQYDDPTYRDANRALTIGADAFAAEKALKEEVLAERNMVGTRREYCGCGGTQNTELAELRAEVADLRAELGKSETSSPTKAIVPFPT